MTKILKPKTNIENFVLTMFGQKDIEKFKETLEDMTNFVKSINTIITIMDKYQIDYSQLEKEITSFAKDIKVSCEGCGKEIRFFEGILANQCIEDNSTF